MKYHFFVISALLSLMVAPAHAQTCPPFPERGVQIIDALYNPVLAQGTDDQRRELTRTFVEQLVFEKPGDGWTWKSADPGRPPSKDSISRIVNGRLCNWDWQSGSTRQRSVQVGQIGDDITGQNPISVAGVNHLIDAPPVVAPPVVTPPPMQTVVDLSAITAQNERIFANLTAQLQAVTEQNAALAAQLRQHDEEPAFLTKMLSNRFVQIAMTSLGTWATLQAAK